MKKINSGTIREVYDVGNDRVVIVTTDRVAALGKVLPDDISGKGVILNKISEFWFDYTKNIIPNHMLSVDNADMPRIFQSKKYTKRCMLAKKLMMLPIQSVVRGYISGTGWESYKEKGSVCGIVLPEGLKESEKLPEPIYTPTTKASNGVKYEAISYYQTIDVVSERYAAQIRDISIELYLACAEYAKTKGIIIADTKFEFGIDHNGELVLADEMFTPDSSRFWSAEDYKVGHEQKSYDKEVLEDWIKANSEEKIPEYVMNYTFSKYVEAYERITGKSFL